MDPSLTIVWIVDDEECSDEIVMVYKYHLDILVMSNGKTEKKLKITDYTIGMDFDKPDGLLDDMYKAHVELLGPIGTQLDTYAGTSLTEIFFTLVDCLIQNKHIDLLDQAVITDCTLELVTGDLIEIYPRETPDLMMELDNLTVNETSNKN